MRTILKLMALVLGLSLIPQISALSSTDRKKVEAMGVALNKLGSGGSLTCKLTWPFDPKPTGVCKDVCAFDKWRDKEVPTAVAKAAAEKCGCSCARTPNNFAWAGLMNRLGKDFQPDPYFEAGIDLKEIDKSSFPSASSLDRDIEGTAPDKDAALLIRANKCVTLNDRMDSKTKATCDKVCALGRALSLLPSKEREAAALKCACYCDRTGHPKAADVLKNIVKSKYGVLSSKEVQALSKYK